jgi:glycosyltransferase involved in cell wall biosynthesis
MPPEIAGVEDIAIVIPAYNAGIRLDAVLEKVLQVIPSSNVIVIDDGSTDDTSELSKQKSVTLIRHQKNLGKGAALKSGFEAVLQMRRIKAAITMDADGQHAPEHVAEFIHTFRATAGDLIIGARELRWPQMPIARVVSNRISSALLSWRLGAEIFDSQSGYRLHSRELIEQIELRTDGYEMESELLIKAYRAGMRIHFVPISTIYSGQPSHIRGIRDIGRFIRMWLTTGGYLLTVATFKYLVVI